MAAVEIDIDSENESVDEHSHAAAFAGEAADDLTLAAQFAIPDDNTIDNAAEAKKLQAAMQRAAAATLANGASRHDADEDDETDSDDSESESGGLVTEPEVKGEGGDAMDEADDDEADLEPEAAGGSAGAAGASSSSSARAAGAPGQAKGGKKPPRPEGEDEEAGGEAPPVRTKNEVPLWQLPIPTLPGLACPPHQEIAHAGTVLHVHRGAGWDFDPLLALEGGAGASGGRSKGKGAKAAAAASNDSPDATLVFTLVVQASLGPGQKPLDERSALALPDRRLLGFVEDVFGPVKSPMYLLRVHARVSVPEAEMRSELDRLGLDPDTVLGKDGAGAGQSAISMLAQDYGQDDDGDQAAGGQGSSGVDATDAARVLGGVQEGTGGGAAVEAAPSAAASGDSTALAEPSKPLTLVRVSDLSPGAPVCFVSPLSSFITPEAILAAYPRGSDASNVYDEEVGPEEAEYSDDEAEATAKARAKALKRKTGHSDGDDEAEVEPDGALLDAPQHARAGRGRGRGRGRGGASTGAGAGSSHRQAGSAGAGAGWPSAPQAFPAMPGQGMYPGGPPYGGAAPMAYPMGHGQYPGYPYPYPPPYGYPPQAGMPGQAGPLSAPPAGFGQPQAGPGAYPGMTPVQQLHAHMAAMAALQAQIAAQQQYR